MSNKQSIGDAVCGDTQIISDIGNVLPVRYDGIDGLYKTCDPSNAEYFAIIADCGPILISKNCKNKEMFIDII